MENQKVEKLKDEKVENSKGVKKVKLENQESKVLSWESWKLQQCKKIVSWKINKNVKQVENFEDVKKVKL